MLIVSGFLSAFISILFTGAIFIEMLFSLDGLALLGYQAASAEIIQLCLPPLFFLFIRPLISITGDLTYALLTHVSILNLGRYKVCCLHE